MERRNARSLRVTELLNQDDNESHADGSALMENLNVYGHVEVAGQGDGQGEQENSYRESGIQFEDENVASIGVQVIEWNDTAPFTTRFDSRNDTNENIDALMLIPRVGSSGDGFLPSQTPIATGNNAKNQTNVLSNDIISGSEDDSEKEVLPVISQSQRRRAQRRFNGEMDFLLMEEVLKQNAHVCNRGKVQAAFETVASCLNSSTEFRNTVREDVETRNTNRGRRHRGTVQVWETDMSHCKERFSKNMDRFKNGTIGDDCHDELQERLIGVCRRIWEEVEARKAERKARHEEDVRRRDELELGGTEACEMAMRRRSQAVRNMVMSDAGSSQRQGESEREDERGRKGNVEGDLEMDISNRRVVKRVREPDTLSVLFHALDNSEENRNALAKRQDEREAKRLTMEIRRAEVESRQREDRLHHERDILALERDKLNAEIEKGKTSTAELELEHKKLEFEERKLAAKMERDRLDAEERKNRMEAQLIREKEDAEDRRAFREMMFKRFHD